MKQTKYAVIVLAVLACLTIVPLPASAEWFAELYGGAAFTPDKDVDGRSDVPGVGVLDGTFNDVDFDTSISIGGRLGYWWEPIPLGLAVDTFVYQPNIDSQTLTFTGTVSGAPVTVTELFADFDIFVTAISFDLMGRWLLWKSEEFPRGRLTPYFTLGPAIFIAKAKDTMNFDPGNQSDSDTSVGVKVGGGLALKLHKIVAFFVEYRFTHFSPKFRFEDSLVGPSTLETNLNTHHAVVGISFRF